MGEQVRRRGELAFNGPMGGRWRGAKGGLNLSTFPRSPSVVRPVPYGDEDEKARLSPRSSVRKWALSDVVSALDFRPYFSCSRSTTRTARRSSSLRAGPMPT
jgi:hypothetical protein